MIWARYHSLGYEVSSAGDKRFSALFAKLPDGRTIEEAYQLDVKGYRAVSSSWRDGKGKPPINGKDQKQLWEEYLELWKLWAQHNHELIIELNGLASSGVLTDRFATSDVNQARALAEIINDTFWVDASPFTF